MLSSDVSNRLLAALSPTHRERLLQDSQPMELPLRMQLFASEEIPRYVYFLTSGVASLVFTSQRGTAVELGTIGREGMVGSLFLLGPQTSSTECMVQVGAQGYRIPLATAQREFLECEEFRCLVLEFVQHQSGSANQIVACNRLHGAEARFARWLLMVQDRIQENELRMTQDFLSTMLGTRRTTVVEVAATLQRACAIEGRRGVVKIADRAKLESFACECYPYLKKTLDDLYQDAK